MRRLTMGVDIRWMCFVAVNISLAIGASFEGKGIIRCLCTTHECIDSGKTMCVAKETCYTELFKNKLTRGCDPNGLACENRQPSFHKGDWPILHCCNDKDRCNEHTVPSVPGKADLPPRPVRPNKDIVPRPSGSNSREYNNNNNNNNNDNNNNDDVGAKHQHVPGQDEYELCPHHNSNSNNNDASSLSSSTSSNPSPVSQTKTKIINPIYIAVPVAGVCVLLALIIFAMYLLRRRTVYHHGHHGHHGHHHHHENFHHYHQHEHVPELSHTHKQTANMPPPHPHHHCQCVCKKQTSSLPPCSKSNRCTESERSSSGSETKLFLQT